jgi:hypothetical protein
VSPPVGPTGLALTCDGSEPGPWRVSVAGGGFRSELSLSGQSVDVAEQSLTATLSWHKGSFGLEGGLGAILGGTLGGYDVSPGFSVVAAGSWLALYEGEVRPFVLLSLSASVSTATTDVGRVTAVDLRGGVVVGKTFFERLTPYLVARVFGGPVSWNGLTGGDQHHYTIGGGATLRLPGGFDVLAEGMALGERSVAIGVGLSF